MRHSDSSWLLKRGVRSGVISSWLKSRSPFFSLCAVFVATSMVWGCIILWTIYFSLRNLQPAGKFNRSPPHHHAGFLTTEIENLICGNSLQEAKDKGCVYDILSNHWIPEECADEPSIKEYQSDGSWFPYADENRTELLAREELGDREFYYTSIRDHIFYCAVPWRDRFGRCQRAGTA